MSLSKYPKSSMVFQKPNGRRVVTTCAICSGVAIYAYCGVVVCPACKIFFKRNVRNEWLKCPYDGRCEINLNSRHTCSSCRMKKCFKAGMKPERIRGPRSKPSTNRQISKFRQGTTRSTFTLDQWTLLTYVSNIYDDQLKCDGVVQFFIERNKLPLKMRYRKNTTHSLIQSLNDGSTHLFYKNPDFLALSSHDQLWIFQRNIKCVAAMASSLMMKSLDMHDDPGFSAATELLFGVKIVDETKIITQLLDEDSDFMKFALIGLIFSTLDFSKNPMDNLENARRFMNIQNKYVDMAWRFLLYRYGDQHAVKSFSKLIRCTFAAIQAVNMIAETNFSPIVNGSSNETVEFEARAIQ